MARETDPARRGEVALRDLALSTDGGYRLPLKDAVHKLQGLSP